MDAFERRPLELPLLGSFVSFPPVSSSGEEDVDIKSFLR